MTTNPLAALEFAPHNPNFGLMNEFLTGKKMVDYVFTSGELFRRRSIRLTPKNLEKFETAWKSGFTDDRRDSPLIKEAFDVFCVLNNFPVLHLRRRQKWATLRVDFDCNLRSLPWRLDERDTETLRALLTEWGKPKTFASGGPNTFALFSLSIEDIPFCVADVRRFLTPRWEAVQALPLDLKS